MINGNSPTLSAEAQGYLRLLNSVVYPHRGVYVAVPITTGARFLDWYGETGCHLEQTEYDKEHRRAVIEMNCADAADRIARIRQKMSAPVIDPSSFDRPGWSQDEYRSFWAAVIENYAAIAVFLDGWQYSNGCSFEFFTATMAKITTLSESLEPLSMAEGRELILGAATEFNQRGLSTPFLESVLERLGQE